MKATHLRPRLARRRAVRAFVLTFWITAVLLAGAWAGLVADVRTRRVCDGDRAERVYMHLAEAIRLTLPAVPDPTPTAPTGSTGQGWLPYPIRLMWAFGEALEVNPAPPRFDAVPVIASRTEPF